MNARAGGFSLIEFIAIIVVLSVAAVGIASAYAPLVRSAQVTQDIDYAAQIAARCAEHILGQRRVNTAVAFAGVTSGLCGPGLDGGGFTVTDTVADLTGGACPVGTCRSVTITATNGTSTRTLNLLLAPY